MENSLSSLVIQINVVIQYAVWFIPL